MPKGKSILKTSILRGIPDSLTKNTNKFLIKNSHFVSCIRAPYDKNI